MEGGPQDTYSPSPSHPLPYWFLRANKALPRSERQHANFPQEEGFLPRQLSEKLKTTYLIYIDKLFMCVVGLIPGKLQH